MNAQQRLVILKKDLQLLTDVHDEYLKVLMEQGQAAIEREGIVLTEGDVESDMAVVQYAAYLFRNAQDGGCIHAQISALPAE